jgi:hypothetical protein
LPDVNESSSNAAKSSRDGAAAAKAMKSPVRGPPAVG